MNETIMQNPETGTDPIKAYGINLTRLALEGKIDPVIGREDEIRRIVQILSRRKKNNPVLIGEPGTGKTTVVEGLAKRIVDGDVPENIKNKELISLDLSAMVAGAMYKGQFEERLKNFIKAVKKEDGKIIIFIDELHMIVGAGGQGQMDVANILKPELARGTFKVIGATTLNEYQKYLESDAALERRFQQVLIAEPNVEDTITILRGIKDKYEVHHKLNIRDSALIAAASLSNRYISDRFLPDKAVDLVDEAASKLRMEMNSAPESIDNMKRKLLQLEVEREALKVEKDQISKDRLKKCKQEIHALKMNLDLQTKEWKREKKVVEEVSSSKAQLEDIRNKMEKFKRNGDYEQVARIQYKDIPDLEEKIDNLTKTLEHNQFVKLEVTTADIAEVIAKWTGIPLKKMLSGEKERLLDLEKTLRKRVIGQDHALKIVSDVIRMSKMGLTDPDHPLGSFLFMGNTGVGKTELAKALAETLFDDEKAMIRIDMSELMEAHSVSKFIGSPPGYVGFDEGGYLTERIRRHPYSVVLFDEIEKAHKSVLNILLQVLDDGRLTDSKGRKVSFENTIIIMTTNLSERELKQFLRPELRNRIDDVIQFNDLNKEMIETIVGLHLKRMVELLAKQNYQCRVTGNVKNYLVRNGYEPEFGARPVKRLIRGKLLANITKWIMTHPGVNEFELDYQDELIIKEVSKQKAAA